MKPPKGWEWTESSIYHLKMTLFIHGQACEFYDGAIRRIRRLPKPTNRIPTKKKVRK